MTIMARLYLVFTWAFFAFLLLSASMPEHYGDKITLYDKVVHFLLFAILSWLLSWLLFYINKNRLRVIFVTSLLLSAVYSLVLELLQLYIPGRQVSELDLLAGVLGAFVSSVVFYYFKIKAKKKMLLHICCIGCGVYVSKELSRDFDLTLFFYNPNIFPEAEYKKREKEVYEIAKKYKIKFKVGHYNHKHWLEKIFGYEKEPEKGKRCLICYRDRLEETARLAKYKHFDYFATTLTTSPHKLAVKISEIGNELEEKYCIKYFDRDFKKKDGFKKSCQTSTELGLYRQDYCGCEFSLAERNKRIAKNSLNKTG